VAKSATQLLSDAEKIRKHAGILARVNKAASDTLKEEASKIEMRAVRRMRQRVKKRKDGAPRTGVSAPIGGGETRKIL